MKKVLLTLMLISCSKYKDNCNSNFDKYIGKDVNFFLESNVPFSRATILDSKPGLAYSLLVVYPNQCTVELIPSQFLHMKQFDTTMAWDINEFKKEKIGTINVYSSDKLIRRIPN
ncbi:hypothetical protein QM480_18470 [Flectobacillus sp. DC10W]|uniref:Lipoprotein n=1 Tax=Flectobacillus longus TaxID=2984207 RepID=A0ABT6YRX8_9BACT|nr:hypothetical protein [Flectobacillus longus]MDI9866331.1 hypothetical protein [Flectobacillus longus]